MIATSPNTRNLRMAYALLVMLQQQRGGVRHSASRGEYIYNANGRTVPDANIQKRLDGVVDAYRGNVERLAERLDSGRLTTAQWQERMRRELKDVHRTQYIVGRGGVDKMTPRDWGRLGSDLRWQQYRALDNFALEIADGNLSLAQIKARSRIYVNASRKQYRRGKNESGLGVEDEPFFMWQRGSTEEPCSDCLALDGQVKTLREWEAAGIEPQSPDLECGGWNCQCRLVQI